MVFRFKNNNTPIMKIQLITILCLLISFPLTSDAQLLGRLKRAVKDKVEKRIEDKIVEELSEELANRAMKPINKAFDEYLKSSYETETGEKWDQAKFDSLMTASGEAYMDFLGGMNKAANVPAEYVFDIVLDIETQEENDQKHRTEMYFSLSNSAMGFHQKEDKQDMIIIMDPDNDVMVMFNVKENKAQAMPSMFSITKGVAAAYVEEEDLAISNFEATGKTKKIAGYNSSQYKGETKDDKFTTYLTTDLPFDWKDTYGGLIESIAPKMYNENYNQIKGMMMRSESINKESKKKSSWEVKKVSEVTKKIKKADFEFPGVEG